MFDEPDEVGADGPRLYPKTVLNHLLIVYAVEYIEHSPTRFTKPGDRADVTVVDVIDLDQVDPETNQPGLLARKIWWRGARLNGSLKAKVGSGTPLLARMGQGTASQGMPPYVLNSMTSDPQAVARANAWFQSNPQFKPSQPSPRWAGEDEAADTAVDASFTPATADPWATKPNTSTSGAGAGFQVPAGHQEGLTALEAMARRATMPPPSPPQPDEPPY